MRRRRDQNYDRQLIGLKGLKSVKRNFSLVHVTPTWSAKEILRSKKFVTKSCRVFDSDLVYFFVLKPAYQSKIGSEESHQLSRFPVAFVLGQSAVKNPRHVYPFDTGGAADGSFDGKADPYIPLEDYALSPTYGSVAEFVSWAFGTPRDYFHGRLRYDLADEIEPYQSTAVSYLDVARLGVEGSNEHDTRSSTIEVASNHNVDLAGNVKLIIAPKQYLEGNDPLMNLIEPLISGGAEIELYDWQANRSPNEYQSDIFRISERWYEKNSYI